MRKRINNLKNALSREEITYSENEILAPYTTYKIGGPADIFIEAKSKHELITAVKLATSENVPFHILGWGSNILVTDKGIRGIVIRNQSRGVSFASAKHTISEIPNKPLKPRLKEIEKDEYYTFEDLNYTEPDAPKIEVEIESGAPMPNTIMTLIREGITGLQWFGGIPGTLGGAVYNNIHGGSKFLSEFITSVESYDPQQDKIITRDKKDCNFDYDYSIFHDLKEIILSAKLQLSKGDSERAKKVYIEWTRRKKIQPQKSAGCVWRNIDMRKAKELGLESNSWGYIIDKILELKGKKIGGAAISNRHAAFIENTGNAKAEDILALMDLIKSEARKKLGIEPQSEIFILGER